MFEHGESTRPAVIAAALLLSASAVFACGDDFPAEAIAAEQMRELDLLDNVPVRRLTREEFAAEAEANASEISADYLQYYADTYGRLGFFDRALDLRPIFAGSSSDWVGATYSPSKKQITLVGDAPRDTAVHEWVHALQDQHFDLREFDELSTNDAFLARRAAVEGDATLAQFRYIASSRFNIELNELDWSSVVADDREFTRMTLVDAQYPVVFLDYVSFVYTAGLEYTAINLMGEDGALASAPHDWSREDALFTERPPASTQQILQKNRQEPIVAAGLDEVPASLAGTLETVDWDTLGEWYTLLLLFPLDADMVTDGIDARSIAAGWDGDRALFVRDRATGTMGTVWASVWDDEATAARIEEALWSLYGRTSYPDQGELPPYVALGDDGELAWVERRGDRVVALRNVSMEVAQQLVDAAFAAGGSAQGNAAFSGQKQIRAQRRIRRRRFMSLSAALAAARGGHRAHSAMSPRRYVSNVR